MSADRAQSSEPVSIMLVDDRPENLLALEAVLEPLGEKLVQASSGEEALKRLLVEDFAVILLDVQMPGIDGFETATLIKQRDRTRDVPIIFLTAHDKGLDNVFKGYESGAVDYLLKPFDPTILRSKVSVFVDLFRKGRALEESEERFRRSFDDAAIGMALVATDGRWLKVNRSLCEITGYSEEELLATTTQEITPHARDLRADLDRMQQVLSGELRSYRIEKRLIHAAGHVVWVLLSVSLVRDHDGRPLHFVSHIEDISERKRAEEEASEPSLSDPLTGLANRALLRDHIELGLARLRRRPKSVAVLFLDLDRFKVVNDSLGHAAGDRLLMQVAGRLRTAVRVSDTVARIGGDTFAVLSEELDDERTPIATAERLAEAVATPFDLDGSEAFVTTSVGIAYTSDPGHDPDLLLSSAEAAMYRAKERGKARYEVFDEGMRARARERLDTETALHRAIERGEIRLLYQPVVEFDTDRVSGVEALVRWDHPQRGTIPPEDFVPLAEETGLILPIGRWVLEEACRQAATWENELGASLRMSVNLSATQLGQPDLAEVVHDAIGEAGVNPEAVCLEITESVAMQSAETMSGLLERLKGLGVRLAIDDFGTGYSSLSYLRYFPFDVLKIDRSFVETLGRDPQSGPIVGAVIGLARALDLVTVAEGVETRDQLDELRRLGCDGAQGFLFGAPAGPEELWDSLGTLALDGVLAGTNGTGSPAVSRR